MPQSGQRKPQRMLPNSDKRHWTCQVKVEIRLCSSLSPLTDPFANPRTVASAVPRKQRNQSPGECEPERPLVKEHQVGSECPQGKHIEVISSADCACSSSGTCTDILRDRGSIEKRALLIYIFFFFLNKTLNILWMCDIDKKYINIFWDFIDNDRQYFSDCVVVLIS